MNYDLIKECTELSEQEKISFPDVISRLSDEGIESYYADLMNGTKTYYSHNEAFLIHCELDFDTIASDQFNQSKVVEAIVLSQSGKIKYQEFIKQVKLAGVFSYFVFIKGRKAIYFGRKGESHVEEFPV